MKIALKVAFPFTPIRKKLSHLRSAEHPIPKSISLVSRGQKCPSVPFFSDFFVDESPLATTEQRPRFCSDASHGMNTSLLCLDSLSLSLSCNEAENE